ncbi:MAG: hypothetical protein ACRD3O_06465 [Terriglobia bacterium]
MGDKVYPSKIAINLKNERIAFSVVACDGCNGTNPPPYYQSEVDFQFPKGFLQKGDVSAIEDTIGEVFTVGNSAGSQQEQGAQGGQAARSIKRSGCSAKNVRANGREGNAEKSAGGLFP